MKRKLFNAALFAAVLIAAPVSTFVSCADYDSDITNLNTQVANLEDLVKQKEATINELIGNLQTKDGEILALIEECCKKAECATTCATKAELAEKVGILTAADTEINNTINALKSALDVDADGVFDYVQKDQELTTAINTAVTNLGAAVTRIEGLEEGLGNTQEDVRNLVEGLTSVRGQLKDIPALIDTKVGELRTEINNTISTLQGTVNGNTAEINEIKKFLNNEGEGTLKALLDELRTKDTELADEVSDVAIALETVTAETLPALTARVEALENTQASEFAKIASRFILLQGQIDGLKDDLDAYKSLETLARQTADAELWAAVNSILGTEEEGLLDQVLADAVEEAQSLVDELRGGADVTTTLASLDEKIEGVNTALETFKTTVYTKQEIDAKFGSYNTLADLESALRGGYAGTLKNLDDKIDALDTSLKAYADGLAAAVSAEVKGLVLEPADYYQGIQAIVGKKIFFRPWTLNAIGGKLDNSHNTPIEFAPEINASYHINPSNAVLLTNVSNYAYKTEDRVNRAASALQIDVTEAKQVDGMLNLKLNIQDATKNTTARVEDNGNYINYVTVAALQYTNPNAKAGSQVITSDYAVIYLETINGVNLNLTEGATTINLDDDSSLMFPAGDTKVPYDETVDITEFISTSYGGQQVDNATVEHDGFKYTYTMVGDEKEFFTVDENGVVTPVWSDGTPATIANVGKVGTVLVTLTKGNDIAAVGYVKVIVTGSEKQYVAETFVDETNFNLDCAESDPSVICNASLEGLYTKVMTETKLGKEAVLAQYTLAENTDGTLKQYALNAEGKYVALAADDYVGQAYPSMGGHTEWPAVAWEIDYATASSNIADEEGVHSETIYVCVESESTGVLNQFFLPINWKPAVYEEWKEVKATIAYTKITNQWQESMGQHSYQEIRVYPNLDPTLVGTGDNAKYEVELFTKAISSEVTFEYEDNEYVDLTDANRFEVRDQRFVFVDDQHVNAPFTFVDEDGVETTYFFSVSEDGTQLKASTSPRMTPVAIATIDADGKITLENNIFTQNILNNSEELDYGKSLYAHVAYKLETCAGEVEVIDGDFDVCFIKPIRVIGDELALQDASAGISRASIFQNIECFNGEKFSYVDPYLFQVFEVEAVSLGEPAEWHTNYNAAADNFDGTIGDHNSIKNLFSVDEAKGEVAFTNNGNTISEFLVKVPVTITYKWGVLTSDVTIVVGRTAGGSNRR